MLMNTTMDVFHAIARNFQTSHSGYCILTAVYAADVFRGYRKRPVTWDGSSTNRCLYLNKCKKFHRRFTLITLIFIFNEYVKSNSWICQQCAFPANIYLFKVNNEHYIKVRNMFKFNSKNTRTTSLKSFCCCFHW